MNEKELLEMMVTERIQSLIQEMKSARSPAKWENTRLIIDQAESILKRLSEQENTCSWSSVWIS